MGIRITDVELIEVDVTRKGNWLVVAVHTDAGIVGYGEATDSADDERTRWLLEQRIVPLLKSVDPLTDTRKLMQDLRQFLQGRRVESWQELTAVSAVEQALHDIRARFLGVPLNVMLGGALSMNIPLYANVNRALIDDRSPRAFAHVARSAVEQGYRAVKCAPFDSVHLRQDRGEWRRMVDSGLQRVVEIRSSIGPDVDLMVDCHGRFRAHDAIWLSKQLETQDVFWMEDAMWPNSDVQDMVHLRRNANLRLAGGEFARSLLDVKELISNKLVDILLPDVKHCGLAELQRIADYADLFGVEIAPHNPSGPVSTAFSAQICSILGNMHSLELAFGEVEWRGNLVSPYEPIENGFYRCSSESGVGFELNQDLEARLTRRL